MSEVTAPSDGPDNPTNKTRGINGSPTFSPAPITNHSPAVNDQTLLPSPATTISSNPNTDRIPSPTSSAWSSRSSSPSQFIPNFNAPAVPAIEVPLSTHPLYPLAITLSSKKRRAAVIGQQQRSGTAWGDFDDSGTYDPKEERRARAVKTGAGSGGGVRKGRGSHKRASIKSASVGGSSRRKRTRPEEAESNGVRSEGPKKFSRRRKRVKAAHNQRSDGLTLDTLTLDHPQYRACKSCFLAGNDECTLIEHANEYPCTACEDANVDCELINPPEIKRSCEGCKRKGATCSFKYDGGIGKDVCDECAETGDKCIAGPSAGGRRLNDVLESQGKHLKTEREMIGKGKEKEPLKLVKGSEPRQNKRHQTQSRTAAAHHILPNRKQNVPTRKYVSCNECRSLGSRCSLKPTDWGPCTRCSNKSQNCTFLLLKTKTQMKSKTKTKHKTTSSSSQYSQSTILSPTCTDDHLTRTLQTESLRKRKSHPTKTTSGTIEPTTILTSFAHPIIFNWNPPSSSPSPSVTILPCTWHSNPFFGLWGFGPPKLVEVIPYPAHTGAGYEELKGGYGESAENEDDREERSRMCVRCTWDRINILGCKGHRMEVMRGVDERLWDEESVGAGIKACFEWVMEGMVGRPQKGSLAGLVWDARWCAVCPSFAEWECKECSLPLCSYCNSLHSKVLRGLTEPESGAKSLGRVITLAKAKDKDEYPDGVRADVSFLREDGELKMRCERGGCPLVGIEGVGCGGCGNGGDKDRGREEVVGLGVDLRGGVVGGMRRSVRSGIKLVDIDSSESDSDSESESDSDTDSQRLTPIPKPEHEPKRKWKGKGVDRGPWPQNQNLNSNLNFNPNPNPNPNPLSNPHITTPTKTSNYNSNRHTNAPLNGPAIKMEEGWMSDVVVNDDIDQYGMKQKGRKLWKMENDGVVEILSDDE